MDILLHLHQIPEGFWETQQSNCVIVNMNRHIKTLYTLWTVGNIEKEFLQQFFKCGFVVAVSYCLG